MKPIIAEDGTRDHEFTSTEKRQLRSALIVVEKAAFHYRDEQEGDRLKWLAMQLQLLHDGKKIVSDPPEEAPE